MVFEKLRKKDKAEELPQVVTPQESSDIDDVDTRQIINSLLGREEVKLYLAVEEGKRLYELATKLNNP